MTLIDPLHIPSDLEAAADEWGANCGPGALAALTGRELADVRSHCLPWKGYMSFTAMLKALKSMGIDHAVMRKDFKLVGALGNPRAFYGRLTIVQWGGPWLRDGVHPGAALCRTHWVAVRHDPEQVYDVNTNDWMDFDEWEHLARLIMRQIPRCDGTWQVRSNVLIRSPQAKI